MAVFFARQSEHVKQAAVFFARQSEHVKQIANSSTLNKIAGNTNRGYCCK